MSSFLDNIFGSSDDSAQNYLQQALAQYQNVQTPSIESEQVNDLPQETVQGTVNPEQLEAVDQAPSAYNDISLDPSTRQAQINALSQYSDIANAGGLDANAKLGLQQALNSQNEASQGAQGAIMQQAQAEGQGGGDFALTQRAIAAQGAANNAQSAGLQAAAEAEANRESALNQMASIGGSVNASDYNQAETKAAAQNTINATNQGYANNAAATNVGNNLTAQTSNVANAQGVNASNTTAGQNNAYYNASLPQQQFNNELSKAQGIAGVNTQQANAAQQASANNSAMTGKLIGAGGTILGGLVGGPAGAAVGSAVGQGFASGAPKSVNTAQYSPSGQGYADGGVVCYAKGGMPHDHAFCMKLGAVVPGKAKVSGDSEKNDTVPAMLSPGELVIPRSVPKDGEHMEEFARKAPVAGTNKKIDLTEFTKGYKKGKK